MADNERRVARILSPAEVLDLDVLPPSLSALQAAKLLGVSKQTIYRAVEAGELQGLRVRNRLAVATRPLVEALGWAQVEEE